MDNPIRLILADDHPVLREGTAQLLKREKDLLVIGEAGDGEEALALVDELKPDLVIMDVRMPRMSGIEATRILRKQAPNVRVLILTAHEDDEYVFSLLQAGASGYLLKSEPVAELIDAIHQVHAGKILLAPAIQQKLVARLSTDSTEESITKEEQLTPREFEILQFLARGLSNRAIGYELSISERTVQAHLTSVFAKLGVASRVEAVLEGIRRGWMVIEN